MTVSLPTLLRDTTRYVRFTVACGRLQREVPLPTLTLPPTTSPTPILDELSARLPVWGGGRVRLTERMEAAARECRGWLEAEACQVPQGPALPGDGRPSASAMAWTAQAASASAQGGAR